MDGCFALKKMNFLGSRRRRLPVRRVTIGLNDDLSPHSNPAMQSSLNDLVSVGTEYRTRLAAANSHNATIEGTLAAVRRESHRL